jgi:hypothetical protein
MYITPRVTDFGRIELHTYQLPGSSSEVEELPTATGGGGGGAGVGLIGLLGGAAVLAGRGSNDQAVAASNDEEEKSVPQK